MRNTMKLVVLLLLSYIPLQPVLRWIKGWIPNSQGKIAELNNCRIHVNPFRPSLQHQQILNHSVHSTIRDHFSLWESSVHCTRLGNGTAWDDSGLRWGGLPWHGSCPRQPFSTPSPSFLQAFWCLLIGWNTGGHPPFAHSGPTAYGGPDRDCIEGLTRMMIGEEEGGRVSGGDANWVESRCRQRPPDPTSLENNKGKGGEGK